MEPFIEILIGQKQNLEIMKEKYTKRLGELTKWSEYTAETSQRKNSKKLNYYIKKKSGRRVFVKNEFRSHLEKIQEHRYNETVLKVIEEDLEVLDEMIAKYKSTSLSDITLPKAYQNESLTVNGFLDEQARKWKAEHEAYKRLFPVKHPKELVNTMNDGTKVRSKTEMFIGNDFLAIGLVIVYEFPIKLPTGEVIYPDFLIYDPLTGKEYIWEHLGLMDNPRYIEHVKWKLSKYSELGYVIGSNLILSSERPGGGADSVGIRKLEMAYFSRSA